MVYYHLYIISGFKNVQGKSISNVQKYVGSTKKKKKTRHSEYLLNDTIWNVISYENVHNYVTKSKIGLDHLVPRVSNKSCF